MLTLTFTRKLKALLLILTMLIVAVNTMAHTTILKNGDKISFDGEYYDLVNVINELIHKDK